MSTTTTTNSDVYRDHARLLATLRSATDNLRAVTQPGSVAPYSIVVGAQLRHAEALRCCRVAGSTRGQQS